MELKHSLPLLLLIWLQTCFLFVFCTLDFCTLSSVSVCTSFYSICMYILLCVSITMSLCTTVPTCQGASMCEVLSLFAYVSQCLGLFGFSLAFLWERESVCLCMSPRMKERASLCMPVYLTPSVWVSLCLCICHSVSVFLCSISVLLFVLFIFSVSLLLLSMSLYFAFFLCGSFFTFFSFHSAFPAFTLSVSLHCLRLCPSLCLCLSLPCLSFSCVCIYMQMLHIHSFS